MLTNCEHEISFSLVLSSVSINLLTHMLIKGVNDRSLNELNVGFIIERILFHL